jgi:hypothetical protein
MKLKYILLNCMTLIETEDDSVPSEEAEEDNTLYIIMSSMH